MIPVDLLSISLLYGYLLATIVIFNRLATDRNIVDFLPSIGWAFIMVLPFTLQWEYFFTESRSTHATGILFVGSVLLFADSLMAKTTPNSHTAHHTISPLWFTALPLLTAIAMIFHLLYVDDIPVLELFLQHTNLIQLAELRDQFSRELSLPFFIKYPLNWITPILAPLSLTMLWIQKRHIVTLLFLALTIFYCVSSLAKGPLLIMMATLLVIVLNTVRLRHIYYFTMTAIVLIPAIMVAGFALIHSDIQHEKQHNQVVWQHTIDSWSFTDLDPRNQLTMGDYTRAVPTAEHDKRTHRFLSDTATPCADIVCKLIRKYRYLVYRWFLTPAEVSQRWYDYTLSHDTIGYGKNLKEHPAQQVGNWAYTSRFPQKYPDSVHAYSSIDADAYVRLGYWGWVIVAVGVLLIRISPYFWRTNNTMSNACYACFISILALLLPMASIQALLVAHGVLVPSIIMYFLKKKHARA